MFESVGVVDVTSCSLILDLYYLVWLEEVPGFASGHVALHAGQCGQCLVVTPLARVFGMLMTTAGGGDGRGCVSCSG